MSRLSTAMALSALGSAALLIGCQLIAGVHDDAVLAGDGGTDGAAPCQQPSDCPQGICVNGACCTESPTMAEVCKDHCGQVADPCGRGYECGECTAPLVCGADHTCGCGPGCAQWSKVFGSTAGGQGVGLTTDPSGNIVLASDFTGQINLGGGDVTAVGPEDAFFAQFDKQGAYQSFRSFGAITDAGMPQQTAVAAAFDSKGNLFIAGLFSGDIDFAGQHLTSTNPTDAYVVKLDPSGHYVWSKNFGTHDGLEVNGLAVDSADDVIVAGTMNGALDFGQGPLPFGGDKDMFVLKCDPAGELLWAKTFGGTKDQAIQRIAIDGADNVIIAGHFEESFDFDAPVGTVMSAGQNDIFVAQLRPNGNVEWAKTFGDTEDQDLYGLAVSKAGQILVTGYFKGTLDFGAGGMVTNGEADYGVYVTKLSPFGSGLWSKGFTGPTAFGAGVSATFTASGDVVVLGAMSGTLDFGGGPRQAPNSGLFVTRFDTNGGHVWSKTFDGVTIHRFPNIVHDPTGDLVVAGNFTGTIDVGLGPLPSAGAGSIFLFKLNQN